MERSGVKNLALYYTALGFFGLRPQNDKKTFFFRSSCYWTIDDELGVSSWL